MNKKTLLFTGAAIGLGLLAYYLYKRKKKSNGKEVEASTASDEPRTIIGQLEPGAKVTPKIGQRRPGAN